MYCQYDHVLLLYRLAGQLMLVLNYPLLRSCVTRKLKIDQNSQNYCHSCQIQLQMIQSRDQLVPLFLHSISWPCYCGVYTMCVNKYHLYMVIIIIIVECNLYKKFHHYLRNILPGLLKMAAVQSLLLLAMISVLVPFLVSGLCTSATEEEVEG